MFFIDITGFDCGGAGVLRIIKFIFNLLDVVSFLVPMGLILMMTIDIAKNVIAGKGDDMKKNLNIAIKRLIYCMALFFVPIIVQFAINLLGNLGVEYADCIEIAQTHDLSQYEINTEYEYNYDGETPDFNKGNGYTVTEDSTNNNNNDSDRTNIFIGDSRCVGIQDALDEQEKSKSEWICETGQGYTWFTTTAVSTLSSKVKTGEKYNIIINLGVNDLSYAENYKNYFNSLANLEKYKDNCNIIIVSVNPIDDAKVNGSSKATDAKVVEFNTTVSNGLNSNVKYCNVYDKVKSNFKTSDGINYDTNTSKQIYDEILKCL